MSKIKDEQLFALEEEITPELRELRITRIVEIYNTKRSILTDDQVASLRCRLSADLYSFVSETYKPALTEEYRLEVAVERTEAKCFLKHFDETKASGISASAAEVLARKKTRIDPDYITTIEDHKKSMAIREIYREVMRAAGQVLNSMSYKSN